MLSIPFRRTAAVSMAEPIKQYISNKYDQHPSMFADDCAAIDNTRVAAVQVADAHVSGIKKLEAYAAQLVWMTAKFPLDVRVFPLEDWLTTQIGIEFPWYPSLGYNTSRPSAYSPETGRG